MNECVDAWAGRACLTVTDERVRRGLLAELDD